MPYRKLPDSDATRAVVDKSAVTSGPARLISAATVAAYKAQRTVQSTAKVALEGEQTDVNALRPAADQLIRDIWDEVEFALRQHDAPALRRRAREWSVFYALRPGEPEEPVIDNPPAPPAP